MIYEGPNPKNQTPQVPRASHLLGHLRGFQCGYLQRSDCETLHEPPGTSRDEKLASPFGELIVCFVVSAKPFSRREKCVRSRQVKIYFNTQLASFFLLPSNFDEKNSMVSSRILNRPADISRVLKVNYYYIYWERGSSGISFQSRLIS